MVDIYHRQIAIFIYFILWYLTWRQFILLFSFCLPQQCRNVMHLHSSSKSFFCIVVSLSFILKYQFCWFFCVKHFFVTIYFPLYQGNIFFLSCIFILISKVSLYFLKMKIQFINILPFGDGLFFQILAHSVLKM